MLKRRGQPPPFELLALLAVLLECLFAGNFAKLPERDRDSLLRLKLAAHSLPDPTTKLQWQYLGRLRLVRYLHPLETPDARSADSPVELTADDLHPQSLATTRSLGPKVINATADAA